MRWLFSVVVAASVSLGGTALAQSKHGTKEEQDDAKRYMDSKLANQGTAASANPSYSGQ